MNLEYKKVCFFELNYKKIKNFPWYSKFYIYIFFLGGGGGWYNCPDITSLIKIIIIIIIIIILNENIKWTWKHISKNLHVFVKRFLFSV